MYHEITDREQQRRRKWRRRIVVCTVLLAVLLGFASFFARKNAREQGAVALRRSIMNAAVRCCAIEGSYPLSLSRLEECYGLRINHNDYVITYEAYASNMAPSVVVVPR
ncbi:MAG: hypothetical protein J6S63_11015 [Atopobiaceae bacterium]|nr:hypothetical protein [Atopobiaceae bacterium]